MNVWKKDYQRGTDMWKKVLALVLVITLVSGAFVAFAETEDELEGTELEETELEDTNDVVDGTLDDYINKVVSDQNDELVYSTNNTDDLSFSIASDFSGVQGTANWYYMSVSPLSSYKSEDYVMLPYYSDAKRCWRSYNGVEASIDVNGRMIPNSKWNAVLCFVAPKSGVITISSPGGITKESTGGNGVLYYINKEEETLHSGGISGENVSTGAIADIETKVKAGEKVYFIVDAKGEGSKDVVLWTPSIAYKEIHYSKDDMYTYTLTDAEKGNVVYRLFPNQSLCVNYSVINQMSFENAEVYVCVYDKKNCLISSYKQRLDKQSALDGKIIGTIEIKLPENTDGLYLKVFIEGKDGKIQPLNNTIGLNSVNSEYLAGLVQPVYDVYAYGAVSDGVTDNTEKIQRAIDDCTMNGGGTVFVHGGVFMTGQLLMKNNVTFHIAEDATLLGYVGEKTRAEAYPAITTLGGKRAIVRGVDVENVTVEGKGAIDANCEKDNFIISPPRTVMFSRCKNVVVKDVTLKNARTWTSVYDDCDNILVDGVNINSVLTYPSDGSDYVNCTNVTIQNCTIFSDDDAIAVKSITYLFDKVEFAEGQSEDWIFVEKLTGNYPIYMDDGKYRTATVPAEITDCNWFRPKNTVRSYTGDTLLSMDITTDSKLYIAYNDADARPDWLTQYKDSGLDMTMENGVKFSLYVKSVRAGDRISLGGNVPGVSLQYIPILVAEDNIYDAVYHDAQNKDGWKVVSKLNANDSVYADSTVRITDMPQKYRGIPAIYTSAGSNNFDGECLVEFTCAFPSNVFVVYDADASELPGWMSDWENTGEIITCEDSSSYIMYKKFFKAGSRITLGSVKSSLDKQYFVMLQPKLRGSENFLIQNNYLNSRRNNGVALGSETWGGAENIRIVNNRFGNVSKTGITVMSCDGAIVKNIIADNNFMEQVGTPFIVCLTARDKSVTGVTGSIENVKITNLIATYCHERFGATIVGLEDRFIENLYVKNIKANFKAGITDETKISVYPALPDPETTPYTGKFGILPAYGLYIRNAKNVVMEDIELSTVEMDVRDAIVLGENADVKLYNCYDDGMSMTDPSAPAKIAGVDCKDLTLFAPWKVCENISNDTEAYRGSGITFAEMPEALEGSDLLQPPAEQRYDGEEIVSFCASYKGTVYVACDESFDVDSNPYFEGFVKTDELIRLSDNTTRVLYKKNVKSGTLVHIGNNPQGNTKQNIVFFKVANLISEFAVYDSDNAQNWNVNENLQSGDKIYGDRTFAFNSIPKGLEGSQWIQPAMDSRLSGGSELASFKAAEDISVYIAYSQNSSGQIPSWLADWTVTGQTISIRPSGVFNLYKKTFAAGSAVLLGGNESKSYNQYCVIVKPFVDDLVFTHTVSENVFGVTVNPKTNDVVIRGDDKLFNPIPEVLLNSILLQPSNQFRYDSDNVASFDVVFDTDVYVAHMDSKLPEWLQEWEYTGDTLDVGRSGTYMLYKKAFYAGETVTLGKNGSDYILPYLVFMKPHDPYYSYTIRE